MSNEPLKVVLPKSHKRNLQIKSRLAAPAPVQDLVNHGGQVLRKVEVTTVFLGTQWNQAPFAKMRDYFNAFFDAYLASDLLGKLSIYGVQNGSRVGTLTTNDVLAGTTLDNTLQAIVTRLTSPGGGIVADANSLLVLYPPQGVIIDGTAINVGKTCVDHCGYHEHVGAVAYAVVPYLECAGCLGDTGLSTRDAMTSVASHELCESMTDPMLDGWFTATGEEIGDLCAWNDTSVGTYTVQKEWINGSGCS
jgi:hypothetical protein